MKLTRRDLSPDQAVIYDSVVDWLWSPNRKPYLTFGGYAGTGKTTLLSVLADTLMQSHSICFATFTGKAANVLTRKLQEAGVPGKCTTLHSLMYMPLIDDETGQVLRWDRKPDVFADLIIVDEASMVGADLWRDLQSYNKPILAVGDHGQLPPVGGNSVNLMENPDLRLERIHRQAEGNPILALAQHVRDGEPLMGFRPADSRVTFVGSRVDAVADRFAGDLDTVVLCRYNRSRVYVNGLIRSLRGVRPHDPPQAGETVICLRNGRDVFNGMRGTLARADVADLDKYGRFMAIVSFPYDGRPLVGRLQIAQFGREKTLDHYVGMPGSPRSWEEVGGLFDHGYAMTVHKSQGSEFREVALIVEPFARETEADSRKWVYTAVTRASEQLYLVC